MSSQRQIEANRRNALKSTGPTSVTGKAVSSMNALNSGIHAKSLILPSGKARRPRTGSSSMTTTSATTRTPPKPVSTSTRSSIASGSSRRYRTAETQMWNYENESSFSIGQKKSPRKVCRPRLEPLFQTPVPGRRHPSRLPPRPQSPQRTQIRSRRVARPGHRPAGTARSPVPKPFTPNHFTSNWLRSAIPRRRPSPTGTDTPNPQS